MAATPLAEPDDVAAIWRPLSDAETEQVTLLIAKASAKLRQACPFDVDARIAQFAVNPTVQPCLDPTLVADVVATVVKRLLVNPDGAATTAQTVGPYSKSATYVNRYDKTGSDIRGAIQITDSDIDQLRPATPSFKPGTFRVGIPRPQVLIPGVGRHGQGVVVDADVFDEATGEWDGDERPGVTAQFPPGEVFDGGDL